MAELHSGFVSPSESSKNASSGSHSRASPSDRRKYLRFRIDDALPKLFSKGWLSSLGIGRASRTRAAINLSEGGVMLLANENIPVGTGVTVRIEMEKYSDFIESSGQIRWCQESARCDHEYYAGIAFTRLAAADLKKIGQMREWFTSREYRNRAASRRRSQQLDWGSSK